MSKKQPTTDELFGAIARAASGVRGVRLELSPELDIEAPLTRLGYALNILLSDLEFRHAQAESAWKELLAERNHRLRKSEAEVQVRDEFLAIAAHELNTPLTSLQLVVQGLRSGIAAMPAEGVAKTLQLAERQTRKLRALVDQLLDVGRIAAMGHVALRLEEADLSVLVRDVAERFAGDAAKVHSALVVRATGAVVATVDPGRIEQILTNLIGNALKFGAGAEIDVDITQTNGHCQLAVHDAGIGIAPERLAHIFDRFERGVPASQFGGLGLGLFIVRELVRAHGGSVRVQSTLGQGSTFVVELPLKGPPAIRAEPPVLAV